MAPGAATFFYSFSDLNPFDSANEGFLSYVRYVNGQPYPPLVHSLSYGDVEADVFLTKDSSTYGDRVDVEFIKMGLRGDRGTVPLRLTMMQSLVVIASPAMLSFCRLDGRVLER